MPILQRTRCRRAQISGTLALPSPPWEITHGGGGEQKSQTQRSGQPWGGGRGGGSVPWVAQAHCGCPRRLDVTTGPTPANTPTPSQDPSAPALPRCQPPGFDPRTPRMLPGLCARLLGTAAPRLGLALAAADTSPGRAAGTQRPQCDWRSCRGAGRAAQTPTPRPGRGAAAEGPHLGPR